jgi:hypothetical protein
MQALMKEEASKVTAVIEEGAARLRMLARVPHASRDLAALSESIAAAGLHDVAEDIGRLAVLEHELKEGSRLAKHGASFAHGTDNDAKAADDTAVRATARRLAHAMRADPFAANLLPAHESHKLADAAGTLTHLRDICARHLVTSRVAAADEATEVSNKASRIAGAEREAALLGEELRRQRTARAKAAGEIEESLAAVRAELAAKARAAEGELSGLSSAGTTRAGTMEGAHDKSGAALKAARDKLTAELKVAGEAHVDAEAGQRKKKVRARAEVEAAVAEHDVACAAALAAVEAMRATVRTEAPPLAALAEYYGKIDSELARVAAEEVADAEAVFMVTYGGIYGRFRQQIVARIIQKLYRPWKVKKDFLANMKAKKKG